MRYRIVISIDCPSDEKIGQFKPEVSGLRMTEGDEQYDYGYLEGVWKKGHHRKWYGYLEQKQFDKLVLQYELNMSTTETMGMMTYEGHLPAISFDSDRKDAIINMYACPCPSTKPEMKRFPSNDTGWNEVKKWMEEKYC